MSGKPLVREEPAATRAVIKAGRLLPIPLLGGDWPGPAGPRAVTPTATKCQPASAHEWRQKPGMPCQQRSSFCHNLDTSRTFGRTAIFSVSRNGGAGRLVDRGCYG